MVSVGQGLGKGSAGWFWPGLSYGCSQRWPEQMGPGLASHLCCRLRASPCGKHGLPHSTEALGDPTHFFLQYWDLNSRITAWATSPALFLVGLFEIGSCELFCLVGLELLFSWSLLIYGWASWVARITGTSHGHLASGGQILTWQLQASGPVGSWLAFVRRSHRILSSLRY
jgi:hypothetical protein